MKKKLMVLSLLSVLNFGAMASTDYCMAIRGNGELMPAHWGAISQVVQKKGYPTSLAGGSSASITMFLMESLSMNPRQLTKTQKALLVKSFQGYFEAMTQTEEGKAIATIIGDKKLFAKLAQMANNLDKLELSPATMAIFQERLPEIMTLLNSKDLGEIANPEFVEYVKTTAALAAQNKPEQLPMIAFRKDQITSAVKNFGKFNAVTDDTLFFRPGLVNFKQLAKILGQMADFYAGIKLKAPQAQAAVDQDVTKFLQACAPGSEKLTWAKLVELRPFCRDLLGRAALTYRASAQATGQESVRAQQMVGANLTTLPTTSVLKGKAAQAYRAEKKKYFFNADPQFGSNFKIAQKDLRFGYWGSAKTLSEVGTYLKRNTLTKNDEKSKKFLALGNAKWIDIISTSPAEPGLSNFIDLNQNMVSAGGWSDLHPTLVLKASGCDDIVYITRKGGESMFSQDVLERLTDVDGFDWADWANLTAAQKRMKRSKGEPSDVGPYASLWSKLYNMANPESSIRTSMAQATTTICTDWDTFNVKKQFNELVEEAFSAKWLKGPEQVCNY